MYTERDMVKAKKWFAKAAEQGDENDRKILQQLDQVAKPWYCLDGSLQTVRCE